MEQKIKALAEFLECEESEIVHVHENTFSFGEEEYEVLTGVEAENLAKEQILDSVWAFNSEFLINHMNINEFDNEGTLKSIRAVQEKCCESCNGLLRAALKDEDDFVAEAIASDGRGHFLNFYDNKEHEVEAEDVCLYVYRRN